jgi:hypothetical protein
MKQPEKMVSSGGKIMKSLIKIFGAVVCSTIIIPDLHADIGVAESTSLLTIKGGTGSYFSTVGAGSNPRWSGANLGLLDLAQSSDTLTLNNFFFENYAYSGGGTPTNASTNNNYLSSSSTAVFKIFRDSSLLSTVDMRQSGVSGNNRLWDLGATPTAINLLAGLEGSGSPITRSLNWTIDWTFNQWTGTESIVSATSTSGGNMSFQTVPEPSGGSLLLAGIGSLLALRRFRKKA